MRAFLTSRGINLDQGALDDPPTALSVHGVGNRKNELFLRRLAEHGVDTYPGSVRFVRDGRSAPRTRTAAGRRGRRAFTAGSPVFSYWV